MDLTVHFYLQEHSADQEVIAAIFLKNLLDFSKIYIGNALIAMLVKLLERSCQAQQVSIFPCVFSSLQRISKFFQDLGKPTMIRCNGNNFVRACKVLQFH